MRRFPGFLSLLLFAACCPLISLAQETNGYIVSALNQILPGAPAGTVEFDPATQTEHWNNVLIQFGGATLIADDVTLNLRTGDAVADGHVRVEQAGQIWVGDRIDYNFKMHLLNTPQFRTGTPPVFARGTQLQGNTTNRTYVARHVLVTTDDVSKPNFFIRASRIFIVPGRYVQAWNAVLYVKGAPLFYYPFYRRNLGKHSNNLNLLPGDRGTYGPYLLSTYIWWLNDETEARIHVDYREKRGVGAGPDLNMDLGRWGIATMKYYYLHDKDSEESVSTNAFENLPGIPKDRQRFYFSWLSSPWTNFNARALVNYQSDQLLLHDFFGSDYGQNPQPNTLFEADKYWNNWSLSVENTPRINDFFDQVERLPDVKLTGFRQQIFNTPLYYESESSAGYYRKYYAGSDTIFGSTNGPYANYSAGRADTFHQLLLPHTFFGWLNVDARAGGRATWYSSESGPGGTNAQTVRGVFNTGGDASFKASQLWRGATNTLLDIDGLRHIIEPSISYVYVPRPNVAPPQLPQFDSQLPSLLVLPVEFPDYNNIDSIDSENVFRFGLRNTLQTMRNGQLDDLLNWNVMLDWNLTPNQSTNSVLTMPQKTFDDLYSDLTFKPRPWITFNSQIRYDINDTTLNMALHELTLTPNERWSLGLGYWYLRGGFLDNGSHYITGTVYYKLDDNWGFRATEDFNAQTGQLQQQVYSLYRDMRNWTVAVSFRLADNGNGQPLDYGFGFSFSLKANPTYHVGDDSVRPYDLLGQ